MNVSRLKFSTMGKDETIESEYCKQRGGIELGLTVICDRNAKEGGPVYPSAAHLPSDIPPLFPLHPLPSDSLLLS